MKETLLQLCQRLALEKIDYVDEFQAAAIEEAIATTLKQAAEALGELPIYLTDARFNPDDEPKYVQTVALTDAQRLLGEDND